MLAAGSYTALARLYGRSIGFAGSDAQPVRMIGDEATSTNVVISTTSNDTLAWRHGAYLLLAGVRVQTAGGGNGWFIDSKHRNCEFGNVSGDMIITLHHASARALGPTRVAGNAATFAHATKKSIMDFSGQAINFISVPTFSTYLFGINDASVNLDSARLTGAQSPVTSSRMSAGLSMHPVLRGPICAFSDRCPHPCPLLRHVLATSCEKTCKTRWPVSKENRRLVIQYGKYESVEWWARHVPNNLR